MGKSRDRATRSGSDPVNIGTTRLSTDSGNIKVTAQDGATFKKIFAEEVRVGSGNDQVIFKRGSDGKAEFQTTSDGGGSTSNLTVGGSSTVTNPSDLPISGNTAGDTILVTSTNNLMIYNGSGWYKIATITNASPTISSAGNSTYVFATDGTPVSIEIVASDPEGVSLQYKYQITTGSLGSTATVTNSATSGGTYSALAVNTYSNNRFFKVTPSTTEAHAGTFAITFSVTDGVNTANSSVSTFTLGFSVSGSVAFDGTGDYIEFPSQYNLGQASADWTVEFWAWFYDFGQSAGNSNANCILIGKNDNGIAIEGYNWHGISPGTGKIRLVRNNSGAVVLTSNTLLVPKTWYHIAVTNTGSSNTQKLYINGVQDSATGSYASAFTFSDAKTIVGGTWWSSQLKLPFRGYLSNVRTVAGSVYSPSAQSAGSTVFDGTGDYLLTAEDSELVLGTGDFTIEHWIYMSSTSTGQIIEFRKQGAGYGTGDLGTYVTSGDYRMFVGSDQLTTGAALSQNKWYHIAIVKHKGTTTLYVDGKLSSDFGAGGTATYADTNNYPSNQLTIGIHGNDRSSYPFNGKLSNVRITIGTALYTDRFTRPQRPFTKVTNTQLLTCQNSSGSITDASDNNVTITAGGDAAGNTAHPFETAGNDYNTGSAFTLPTSGLTAVSNTKLLTLTEAEEPSVTDGSYLFNADAENLLINHADMALGSGDWTIDWWFKILGTPSSNNWFFSIGTENADGIQCYYTQSGNHLNFWDIGGNGSMRFALTNHGSETGEWYHARFCRNGNNHYVFINGNCIGGAASNGSIITTGTSWTRSYTHAPAANDCRIGAYYGGNYGWEDGLLMSDFRIIKGTSLQTSAAQFSVPTTASTAVSGTVLLTCQNSTGNATVDNSGTNKTISVAQGTVTPDSRKVTGVSEDKSSIGATPTYYGDVAHNYATPFAQGTGGSVYFDGNGDYADAPDSAQFSMGTGDFTIEGWIYPYDTDHNEGYWAVSTTAADSWNWNSGVSLGFLRGYGDGGNLGFYGIGAEHNLTTTVNPAINTWFHFAFVRISSTLKIYIDGVEKHSASDSTNYTGDGIKIGGLGSISGVSRFNMSNFRIVKGTGVYTGAFSVPTSALTAVSGTSLLTCNDSNVFNDASSFNHTIKSYGDTIATRFNPF